MELLFTEQLDQAQTKQQFISLLNLVCDEDREEFWVAELVNETWRDEHLDVFVRDYFQGDIDTIAWDVNRFTIEYIEKGSVLEH